MPAERYWEVLNSVAKRDFKKMMPLKNKPVYIIGNGEHARVISALLSVTTKSGDHFFISKTS